jgi:hypothetical protein
MSLVMALRCHGDTFGARASIRFMDYGLPKINNVQKKKKKTSCMLDTDA